MSDLVRERAQLTELACRIHDATVRAHERPSFVHWSDAQMLFAVVRELDAQVARTNSLSRALDAALQLARPNPIEK